MPCSTVFFGKIYLLHRTPPLSAGENRFSPIRTPETKIIHVKKYSYFALPASLCRGKYYYLLLYQLWKQIIIHVCCLGQYYCLLYTISEKKLAPSFFTSLMPNKRVDACYPPSRHCNYGVVLMPYCPPFSMSHDHPLIFVHITHLFLPSPHDHLQAWKKILNHGATVPLIRRHTKIYAVLQQHTYCSTYTVP